MKEGLVKWLLQECVRANPFYVISALLMMYGLFELNHEIDARKWQAGAHLSAYALLQVYELCVLWVATVVLRSRRNSVPGRDCHGLMIVAALFLSGSFLAQDELVAKGLTWSALLVPLGMLLAWAKITWYGRLPGVYLPRPFQHALLAVVMAHGLGSVLGLFEIMSFRKVSTQPVAWFLGWISLTVIFLLIHRGYAKRPPNRSSVPTIQSPASAAGAVQPDPLSLPRCGFTGLGIATVLGMAHLAACDWVFDRELAPEFCAPAVAVIAATFALHRHKTGRSWTRLSMACTLAPAALVAFIWYKHPPWVGDLRGNAIMAIGSQMGLAATLTYTGLAWSTKRWSFLWGLAAPLGAPGWSGMLHWKDRIPYFTSILSAGIGFTTLFLGMWVSLYRDVLLKKLRGIPSEEP